MRVLTLRIIALVMAFALPAHAFDTNARAAWVYDVATGTVLMEKNADEPLPPASMSKLMTLNMLFEALHDGRVAMDTTFPVSTKAWHMGGSKMFVEPADRPTVEELIHGIIINSGNDACVVVAEGLAGTEEAFARLMNERAKQLGMTNSHFANSSGWPDPQHRMSMHDLGILAARLITQFPELYKNFALTEYNYKGRVPSNANNRNPLLRLGSADWKADGLKTGHTQEAGYGLVGSAVQGDRRIIFVVTGLPSERARSEEAERIVNWGYRQFTMRTIVPKGEIVAQAPVWLGDVGRVGLTTEDGVKVLLPAGSQSGVTAEAVFNGPIEAPITKGDKLGELLVNIPGAGQSRLPLIAASDVGRAGVFGRLQNAAERLGERAMKAATN
ncbi:MAG TPA: D-alanyl-D-alanine carboxypeptidase family protein [Paracoccus sp. (in: a-proteobacteria)]|uniref:D-alanyl-D-alanine carboxypeptidase family protein n=1 Tax=Paracoccus sp. TaxID=267 RepID=UPI002BACAFDA|nr:D-alanyl-D-alanine carboxypeptidase family protein [Paracoccus sp. (in: a-proteobacteria)]HWL58112.1 D-alanyl-D-alanine carboxypeptidase family protein [Paracoccus sp. (in: a-proteobacteria)]